MNNVHPHGHYSPLALMNKHQHDIGRAEDLLGVTSQYDCKSGPSTVATSHNNGALQIPVHIELMSFQICIQYYVIMHIFVPGGTCRRVVVSSRRSSVWGLGGHRHPEFFTRTSDLTS